jgi:hypothetical protein
MEPAGTTGIGFLKGVVFWTIQISILIPLLIATQHLASHYVKLHTPRAPWIQTVLSGVVVSLLFVPIAYLLDALFALPEEVASGGILMGLLDEASGVLVPVTITWLALNTPWILQLDFSKRQPEVASEESVDNRERSFATTEQSSRFLQELRSRASGDLISISSELHYLRVATTDDEVMFLYNLKDAIEELPSISGVQVHRSHWVASAHVRELRKTNGNTKCILSNGKSLPVSRRKLAEVRDLLDSKV